MYDVIKFVELIDEINDEVPEYTEGDMTCHLKFEEKEDGTHVLVNEFTNAEYEVPPSFTDKVREAAELGKELFVTSGMLNKRINNEAVGISKIDFDIIEWDLHKNVGLGISTENIKFQITDKKIRGERW